MKKILFIGYGNPDREDDGVAWHILREVALRFGLPVPDSYEDEFPLDGPADFSFYLQLAPVGTGKGSFDQQLRAF